MAVFCKFLFVFLSLVDQSKEGCFDYFKLHHWTQYNNMTDLIPLMRGNNPKEIIECTLWNMNKTNKHFTNLLNDCYRDNKLDETCTGKTEGNKKMYGLHFWCLLAKLKNVSRTYIDDIKACENFGNEIKTVLDIWNFLFNATLYSTSLNTSPPTTSTCPPTASATSTRTTSATFPPNTSTSLPTTLTTSTQTSSTKSPLLSSTSLSTTTTTISQRTTLRTSTRTTSETSTRITSTTSPPTISKTLSSGESAGQANVRKDPGETSLIIVLLVISITGNIIQGVYCVLPSRRNKISKLNSESVPLHSVENTTTNKCLEECGSNGAVL